MPYLPTTFALLDEDESRYEPARAAVLPLPFERTTSYGKGTVEGPGAILRASQALEVYDEELDSEPCSRGIATLPPFAPEAHDLEQALGEIRAEARRHLEAGKFLVSLGGEHSISSALAFAARDVHGDGDLGVVQLDAHADLREEYEGTPWSHASVMRRIVEAGLPTLAVGIRSLSAPEERFRRSRGLPTIWGHELDDPSVGQIFKRRLDALPERVYLTFDVDYFDPSLVPATGTPEPGGASWYPTLRLLRTLFERKTVVAMDVVELAPIGGQPAPDFLAAKLAYKCIGYEQRDN
ncbi:MAG: agmatinase [Acidobacteriota bacterium]|jgi:agmatinase